jgi:hypothetical protein
LAYFLITSLASDLDGCFFAAGAPAPRWKTEEKRVAKDERYCFPVRLLAGGSPAKEAAADSGWCRWRSSSVAELGRDDEAAESGSSSAAQSAEKDDDVLPLESREELDVEVESDAEAEDVDADDSSSVRTMEMRGDSCSGRSWPL